MPTPRTLRKFGRDLGLAIVVAGAAWIGDNIGLLDLGPQGTAIAVAIAALVYRWARGLSGREPAVRT